MESWLDEDAINKWQTSPYPTNAEDQPILPLSNKQSKILNGMAFDTLNYDVCFIYIYLIKIIEIIYIVIKNFYKIFYVNNKK